MSKAKKFTKMNKELNDRLRKNSGEIDIDGRLVDFLYTLMRDHLPFGVVGAFAHNASELIGAKQVNE